MEALSPPGPRSQEVRALAALFLKLGIIGFGGPAAHIAMMRREVVDRRRWMTDQEFLDLLGATNLIPGPNSTEMAIHIGDARAGWPGLITAGACFILPSTLIVLALAWAYVTFGSTPQAHGLLYGVKPVIIAIVAQAIWGLGRKAVKGWLTGIAGVAVLAGYFLGVDTLALLVIGAAAVMLVQNARRLRSDLPAAMLVIGGSIPVLQTALPFGYGVLFLTFLKIGAVLYGSGYTLLAFLQNDFVNRLGWLTDQQLIDAVAVGQFTPGPVSTTATFIGYVMGSDAGMMQGIQGALIATLGIFIPSFLFVALTHPIVPRLRESVWAGAFLDGANVAALGLMAGVTITLARAAFVDPITVAMGVIAGVLLVRFNVNSAWLVLGGAAVGLLVTMLV